jgi:hypothetical protein
VVMMSERWGESSSLHHVLLLDGCNLNTKSFFRPRRGNAKERRDRERAVRVRRWSGAFDPRTNVSICALVVNCAPLSPCPHTFRNPSFRLLLIGCEN